MNIFERTRQLEMRIARKMTATARTLARSGPGMREPLEITHAIVDAVEREIQPGGRGTRVFPFNTLEVWILAPSDHARARLEHAQSRERLKSDESRAVQQIRDAWWKIDMNAKRIATTRAARDLADQRLDAERKRFEVGLSTSFFVIQAQRDLAQAKANELAAILAYDLALVDFEALQEAGPAGQSAAPAAPSQTPAPAAQPAAATATTARPANATNVLGF